MTTPSVTHSRESQKKSLKAIKNHKTFPVIKCDMQSKLYLKQNQPRQVGTAMYFFLLCMVTLVSTVNSRNWDYSFEAFEKQVFRPDLIDINIKVVRIRRGDYALNGTITYFQDLGQILQVSVETFRSPRGNDDYKQVPFNLPKQSISNFFNGIYKDVIMEDIHGCAPDAPYFKDEWDGILLGAHNYNMCKLSFDNWPDSFLPGYYKIVVYTFDDQDEKISSSSITIEIVLKE